ncbi:MAG: hypothetical protein BGP16_00290 [Sphingobium sp. 66-54]|nr:MAG: hypothetical protein BGP16_00290 [Sphingobium sp. 66-54]
MTVWQEIQRKVGVAADGVPGPATAAAIARALGIDVPATSIPDDYWPMLARIESDNQPYIKAGSSSASGLYQFIRATWIAEGGQWGSDLSQAFGGLKPSVEEQLARAKTFTAKNAGYLRSKGIPINRASLYAAHFFGPQTAARVIGADVDARADLIAGEAATKANPSILRGKTVGQFLTWLHGKTGEWAR